MSVKSSLPFKENKKSQNLAFLQKIIAYIFYNFSPKKDEKNLLFQKMI